MSELEQTMVIEKMNQLTEEDRRFLLGVMAGLTAKTSSGPADHLPQGGRLEEVNDDAEGAPDGGAAGGGALEE